MVEGPAGRAAARRRGGHDHADRRDDREPVLLPQHAAALPMPAAAPGAARRRGGRAPCCGGRSTTASGASASWGSRSPTTRWSTSSRSPAATPAWRSPGLEAAAEAARAAGDDRDHPRGRGRRRAEEGDRVRPAGRRALRRDQRVHQVDPRLRPRRGAVLARPHDRGGGGPAVHRPAPDRPRERGHRHGRFAGAAGRGRRGGAGGRARRAARGAAEPRPRRPCTSPRRRSPTASYAAIGAAFEDAPSGRARAAAPARRELSRRRSSSATARATGIRTTSPGTRSSRTYRPASVSRPPLLRAVGAGRGRALASRAPVVRIDTDRG